MKLGEIDELLVLIKNFIESNQIDEKKFKSLLFSVYNFQIEHNSFYRNLCINLATENVEEIPLISTSELYGEHNIFPDLQTKMPYPGIRLKIESATQYIRDTEIFKDSIYKTFATNVLEEESLVPWINFIGVCEDISSSIETYFIKYLSDLFHGKLINKIIDNDYFYNILIEAYGEQVVIENPTVLISTQKKILGFLSYCKENEKIDAMLPLGSKVIELENAKEQSSIEISKRICDVFGLNNIYKMMQVPGINSQFYAKLSKRKIDDAVYKNSQLEIEYFSNPWTLVRVLKEGTTLEVNHGESGEIAIYDLSSIWSCPFVRTNYAGRIGRKGGLIIESR